MNQIPVKKNEKYIVDIIDNGFGGEGIAKVDGFTIFIPRLLASSIYSLVLVAEPILIVRRSL